MTKCVYIIFLGLIGNGLSVVRNDKKGEKR